MCRVLPRNYIIISLPFPAGMLKLTLDSRRPLLAHRRTSTAASHTPSSWGWRRRDGSDSGTGAAAAAGAGAGRRCGWLRLLLTGSRKEGRDRETRGHADTKCVQFGGGNRLRGARPLAYFCGRAFCERVCARVCSPPKNASRWGAASKCSTH